MWAMIVAWIQAKAVLIAGVTIGALTAFFKIRDMGKQAERAKNMERVIDSIKKKDEVSREVDRLPDGDAARRLRDSWTRD